MEVGILCSGDGPVKLAKKNICINNDELFECTVKFNVFVVVIFNLVFVYLV